MNRHPSSLLVLSIAIYAASHALTAVAQDPDIILLLEAGEFEVSNGDSKVLFDGKQPEPYRVCVAKGPDAVPLSVHSDGQVTRVNVGSCVDVKGRFIKLEPAARLRSDEVLIGKYHHVR